MVANRKFITLFKTGLLTALVALGIGVAHADPLLPRAPAVSTEVFVPGHYVYRHGERVYVPSHYVVYVRGCKWSDGYYYMKCDRKYGYMYRVF